MLEEGKVMLHNYIKGDYDQLIFTCRVLKGGQRWLNFSGETVKVCNWG